MLTIKNEEMMYPIKIWLEKEADIEISCLEQAKNLSNLPFISQWVALMPDTHRGMGMPIGGVIACDNTIIPNAVGSDIGCGMSFTATNIKWDEIKGIETANGSILHGIIGDILRNIPVGFRHHKERMPSYTLDIASEMLEDYEEDAEITAQIDAAYFQIGTLGGGNHFIEMQVDQDGYLCVMLHSGSRHMGKSVCDYFHKKARDLNQLWFSKVPDEYGLAFLPSESMEGMRYIKWMQLCLDYAYENRQKMMLAVKAILDKWIGKYTNKSIEYNMEINCHHNYASLEEHFGQMVWVHRKGAVRAQKGEITIIPGAMGSYSYIAEGMGSEESFCSCSHGAGRLYSRKSALDKFSTEEVMCDLKSKGVLLGKKKKYDVAEESRFAYKDIQMVMKNQADLVRPIRQMQTIGVVKG